MSTIFYGVNGEGLGHASRAISIVLHRPLEGKIKFATISKNKAGQYFVSITTERTIPVLPKTKKAIGLDLNVKAIVDNNGTKYKNPLPKTNYRSKLKKLYCIDTTGE